MKNGLKKTAILTGFLAYGWWLCNRVKITVLKKDDLKKTVTFKAVLGLKTITLDVSAIGPSRMFSFFNNYKLNVFTTKRQDLITLTVINTKTGEKLDHVEIFFRDDVLSAVIVSDNRSLNGSDRDDLPNWVKDIWYGNKTPDTITTSSGNKYVNAFD